MTITGNTISGNRATGGGGIYWCDSAGMIADNTIVDNTSGGYGCYTGDGGGIYCEGEFFTNLTISGNTITGNRAINDWGGCGGGVYCRHWCLPAITNNLIAGNHAIGYGFGTDNMGGGIYGGGLIMNNTIVGNTARYGGAICEGGLTVAGNIVAFNSSGIPGYNTRYNCVFGNTAYNYAGGDPTGTNGNISADPLFVSASPGPDATWGTADDTFADLHLTSASPCKHAGDPAYSPASGETDIDGQPRKIGLRVDIGADEFCWLGDINFDSYVNVGDLQLLVAAWGMQEGNPGYNPAADCNGDTHVNVGDLQILVANWAKGI